MTQNEIEKLIEAMPLEEKVAQLYGVRLRNIMEDGKISIEKCREWIPHGVGHVCQFSSGLDMNASELAELITDLQEYVNSVAKCPIPLMIHEEAITGIAAKDATATPQMIGMGCTWNPALVYENAKMTAENMNKMGCYYALSPMMDVITDARWGRGEEGYGADSHLTTAFSEAFIHGLQEGGVAATAKHYAGYGIENQELAFFRNEVLRPFEAAVKAGKVKAVMPGYHTFHDIPCSASEFLLTKILREEWGFEGLVVSDYGAVGNIESYYHAASTAKEAGIMAFKAGVDVEFEVGKCYPYLVEAVQEGTISEDQIDTSLYRVLSLKNDLGLLDQPGAVVPKENVDLDPPENRARALNSAREAVVLLKNDGILPIQEHSAKIAMVGPNANSYYSMLGDYTWVTLLEFFNNVKASRYNPLIVTLLDGLKNHLPEADIQFERGCDWVTATDKVTGTPMGDSREQGEHVPLEDIPETNWNRAIQIGAESDLIVAAVGENRFLCGEGCDRSDVSLPGEQEKLVEELCALGKPVVLVVFGGRPMAITEIAEKCAAVIYAWYPGEEGGNALAEIITGATEPSGKLTVTLPDSNADVPVFYQQGEKAERCKYPFGFGLSYTTFAYSDLEVPETIDMNQESFDVCFSVANIGSRKGTEIAQIYASSEGKSKELIGFTRLELGPGEKKTAKATFFLDNFAKYDAEGVLHLKPQKFELQIGASSVDIRMKAKTQIVGEERVLSERRHFLPEYSIL